MFAVHDTRIIVLGLALFLIGLGLTLAAQPAPPPPPDHLQKPAARPAGRIQGIRRHGRRPLGDRTREPGDRERYIGAVMKRLQQENPEEFKRLQELHETDREEFFREIRKLVRSRQGDRRGRGRFRTPEEEQCEKLAQLYHQTDDPAEKERIRKELEAAVQQAFEARLRNARERLERLENQMQKFRTNIDRLEKYRDRIVKTRVEELTRPPELNWDAKW
jgi:DNA repair exonuclease SbcCD ATPase subunit